MRCFIAIELPENLKEYLSALIPLKAQLDGVNLVQKDNFHITLKFLGEVEEKKIPEVIEQLKQIASEFSSFDLKITMPGVFPNKEKPRVIWIGTGNTDVLVEIAKKIDKAMETKGFKTEERAFTSHITVARVKNYRNGKYLFEKIMKEFLSRKPDFVFSVKDFALMKSTLTPKGSIYSVLERFSLGK